MTDMAATDDGVPVTEPLADAQRTARELADAAERAQAAARDAVRLAEDAARAAREALAAAGIASAPVDARPPLAAEPPAASPAVSAHASGTDSSPVSAPPEAAVGDGPLNAAQLAAISNGYATTGAALELGAVVNGDAAPSVQVRIPIAMTNRHGLIAGATGTGKTRTLQVLVEQLSAAGVPVFAADIKGDLSGIATPGEPSEKLLERTAGIGQPWAPASFPTEFYTLGGRGTGVPIRATVAGFGPLLLSKALGLNATQESSLGLVFHYAEDAGLPLLDLADLRAVLTYLVSDEGKPELADLGGLSKATVGVILRELITFADRGADVFFGEPEMDTAEFLRLSADGRGVVSLLEVPGVADQPELYSTFLMWLLADLFNDLPEVGDLAQPKLVFFFDEAHLLFADASKDFLAQVVRTVRLIRSKGVGIFFVTQTPKDLPSDVLAQLGSRIQHQLRAFTPEDAKALSAAVSTYPTSPYDLADVLTSLGTGEAVVTVMNEKGAPSPVAWTRLRAPLALMSPTPEAEMRASVLASPLQARYGTPVDRQSARELLAARLEAATAAARQAEAEVEAARTEAEYAKQKAAMDTAARVAEEKAQREYERLLKKTSGTKRASRTRSSSRSASTTVLEQVLGSAATKTILTGVVEGIFGTRRRR
jgi:DNA helicase HerA-like ATPase